LLLVGEKGLVDHLVFVQGHRLVLTLDYLDPRLLQAAVDRVNGILHLLYDLEGLVDDFLVNFNELVDVGGGPVEFLQPGVHGQVDG